MQRQLHRANPCVLSDDESSRSGATETFLGRGVSSVQALAPPKSRPSRSMAVSPGIMLGTNPPTGFGPQPFGANRVKVPSGSFNVGRRGELPAS